MRTILFLLVIFFSTSIYAQNISFELNDFIEGSKYNAYLGVNNNITSIVENEKCDSIFILTDNGTIKKDSINTCHYIFKPTKLGLANLDIKKITVNGTKTIGRKKIRVKQLPFTTRLAYNVGTCGLRTVTLSRDEAIKARLRVEALNTGISLTAPILGFDINIIRNNDTIFTKRYPRYNNTIVKTIEKDLSIIQTKDHITYSNIIYYYTNPDRTFKADQIQIFVE